MTLVTKMKRHRNQKKFWNTQGVTVSVSSGILGRHRRESAEELSGLAGESFAASDGQTDRQSDRLIILKDWSPILKTSSPLWPSIQPHPLLLHPLIPSSLTATLHTSSRHHPQARLWTVFANTHTHTRTHARTHTHKTPHRDPQDYISGPKHSPKSILVLTKSDERGWLMRRIWLPTLQRGRSETEDLATLPRHLRYPSDDITTARDLQAATVIKCD